MDKTLLTAFVGAGVGAAVAAFVSYQLSTKPSKASDQPRAYDDATLENKIRNAVLSQASALREAVPGPKVYPPVATPEVQVRASGAVQLYRLLCAQRCNSLARIA